MSDSEERNEKKKGKGKEKEGDEDDEPKGALSLQQETTTTTTSTVTKNIPSDFIQWSEQQVHQWLTNNAYFAPIAEFLIADGEALFGFSKQDLVELVSSNNKARAIALHNKLHHSQPQVQQEVPEITQQDIEAVFNIHTYKKKAEYFFVQQFGRQYPLISRKESITTIKELFQNHYNNDQDTDRKVHPYIAFAGCPGSGKSRMLDEMVAIISPLLQESNNNIKVLPIKVAYTNGTPFGEMDKEYPVAAFYWRLLYAYYNLNIDFNTFWTILPKNWHMLNISIVFKILFQPNTYVLLLLDEFQYLIPDHLIEDSIVRTNEIVTRGSCTSKPEDYDSTLQKLIVLLSVYTCNSSRSFWMAMSGIYVGTLTLITSKSGYPIVSIPLPPVASTEYLMKSTIQNPSSILRLHISHLIGIPQLFIEYNQNLRAKLSNKDAYNKVVKYFCKKFGASKLNWVSALCFAVAKFIVNETVQLYEIVGDTSYHYEDLQSNGFLIVDENDHLYIPYPLLMFLTTTTVHDKFQPMVNCLKYIKEEVDDRFGIEDNWILWERFGAALRALKTNAMLSLNKHKTTFGKFHDGAIMSDKLKHTEITLHELNIERSVISFGENNHNYLNISGGTIHWKNGICVVLNAERGQAIDFFTYLPDNHLLDADQRKNRANKLTPSKLLKYVSSARKLLGNNACVGIFYHGPSSDLEGCLNDKMVYVVAGDNMKEYYSAFKEHPLVSVLIYINENTTNQTAIASCLYPGSTKKLNTFAAKVVEIRQKGNQFSNFKSLKETVSFELQEDFSNLKCTDNLKFDLFEKAEAKQEGLQIEEVQVEEDLFEKAEAKQEGLQIEEVQVEERLNVGEVQVEEAEQEGEKMEETEEIQEQHMKNKRKGQGKLPSSKKRRGNNK